MRKMSFQIYPQFRPICISRRYNGKFVFKKNKDGTFNKTKVICTLCGKVPPQRDACVGRRGELKWNAPKHPQQRRPLIQSACDKLASTVAKWIYIYIYI